MRPTRAVRPSPPPTIDHPQRLWVGGAQSRPARLRIFPKKLEGFSEKPGKVREFSNARAFAKRFYRILRRHALGVVRGDEPDCPGERNLITALKGLQRAADRCGNRGTRFRALVL
jgi:hypothetical protein